MGRGFGVLTVYCSMLLSFLTWLLEKLVPLSKPLTDQPFLELCYGMMLPAVGSAILFNCNAFERRHGYCCDDPQKVHES